MTATIYVVREWESIEYHFAVEVSLDGDGDVEAVVGEDVAERYWTTRYGGLELEETGALKYEEGDEIELEDDELDEAREAIRDMEDALRRERGRLKEIFRPPPPASGEAA